jgi:hypothetical protein
VNAAGYVARKGKSETVAHFTNLSPTVLYGLADGRYTEQEEAAILAAAREGRVDADGAHEIWHALNPDDDDDAEDADDADGGGEDGAEDGAAEDPEIAKILDGGASPDVPPPAPNPPPTNFALRDFDDAISKLKNLMTKPSADFAGTAHSAEDLQKIEDFIHTVRERTGAPR